RDYVELNFARPALDRIGFGAQPGPCGQTLARSRALPFEPVRTAGRHCEFEPPLVELSTVILEQRRHRRMRLASFGHIPDAFHSDVEGLRVDFVRCDLTTQDRVAQNAVLGTNCFPRALADRAIV